MDMRLDIWSITAMVLVCALALYGFRLLRQRIDEQRYQEQLSELEFEQTLFSGVGQVGQESQDLIFLQKSSASAVTETAVQVTKFPPNPPLAPQADAGDFIPADIAAESIVRQLKISGLMGSVEGYIELHGNPKGAAILSLRNGKRALLVPHMESEAFFRHNAPRADIIIVMGCDGKGLVFTPLEQLI